MSYNRYDRVTDHEETGLQLWIDQFLNKPRLEGLLGAYLKQVQDLEDAIYDVIVSRFLDNAVGAQLATLGRIVGEPNTFDLSDDEYRVFIGARIRINRSIGLAKDILEVRDLLSETPLLFDEYFPAAMLLEWTEVPDRDPALLATYLRQAKAGGVWLGCIAPTVSPATQFLWKSYEASDVAANGFGDYDTPSSGGRLSDGVFTPR